MISWKTASFLTWYFFGNFLCILYHGFTHMALKDNGFLSDTFQYKSILLLALHHYAIIPKIYITRKCKMWNVLNTKKDLLLHITIRKCKLRNMSIKHLCLIPFFDLEKEKTCNYITTIVGVPITYVAIELFLVFKMDLCYFVSFVQISIKQNNMLNAIHYPKCMDKQKCFNLFTLFGQPIHHIYSG